MEEDRDDVHGPLAKAEDQFAFLLGVGLRKGSRGRRTPRQSIPPGIIAHLDVAEKEWRMEGADEEQLVIEALFELQQQSNGSGRPRLSNGAEESAMQRGAQSTLNDSTQCQDDAGAWNASQHAQRSLYQHSRSSEGPGVFDWQVQPPQTDMTEDRPFIRMGNGAHSPSGSKRRRAWHAACDARLQLQQTAPTADAAADADTQHVQGCSSPKADGMMDYAPHKPGASAQHTNGFSKVAEQQSTQMTSPTVILKEAQAAQAAAGLPINGTSSAGTEAGQGLLHGGSAQPGNAAPTPNLPLGMGALFPNLANMLPQLAKLMGLPNGMQLPLVLSPDGQVVPLPGWPAMPGISPMLAGPMGLSLALGAGLSPAFGKLQGPGMLKQPQPQQQSSGVPSDAHSPRKQTSPSADNQHAEQQQGKVAVTMAFRDQQDMDTTAGEVAVLEAWAGSQGPGSLAAAVSNGAHTSSKRCLIHVHIAHFIHEKQQAAKAVQSGLQATIRATILPTCAGTPCSAAPTGVEAESSSADLGGQERGCRRRLAATASTAPSPDKTGTADLQAGDARAQPADAKGASPAPCSPAATATPASKARVSRSPSTATVMNTTPFPFGPAGREGQLALPWGFPHAAQIPPGFLQAMQSMYAGQMLAHAQQAALPLAALTSAASAVLNNGGLGGLVGAAACQPGLQGISPPPFAGLTARLGPAAGLQPMPLPILPGALPFLAGLPTLALPSGPTTPQAAAAAAASATMAALAAGLKAPPVGLVNAAVRARSPAAMATPAPVFK